MPQNKNRKNEFIERAVFGTLIAAVCLAVIYIGGVVFNIFATLVTLVMLYEFRGMIGKRKTANKLLWYFIMLVYLTVPMVSIVVLRAANYDALMWLVITIAASDIGGYAVGKLLGKRKLAPKISPKKTWEGLAGCCAFAGIASYAYTQMPEFIVIGVLLALISQAGDLTESLIKRYFNVKDTASIIPGHGGFMDRLDGYLYAAPLALLWQLTGVLAFV